MSLRYFGFDSYAFAPTPNPASLSLVAAYSPRVINRDGQRASRVASLHGRAAADAPFGPAPQARPGQGRRGWRRALVTATVALVAVPLAGIPAAHAASSNPKDEAPAASVASGQGRKSSAAAHNAPATRTGDTSAAPDSKSAQHGGAGDKSTPKSAAIGNGQAATKPAAKSADGPTSQAAAAQTSATGKSASPQGKDQSKGTKASANNQSNAQTLPSGNADLNQLLRLWGVFGAHLHIHCSELQIGDLRCLADRGNLATLERYNRPALLVIQHGTGLQTVLLSAINKKQKTVTLVGGQGARNVDIQLLKSVWTGRFEMIWRADAGVRLIRPGSVGSAVVWLRKRLTLSLIHI